MKSNTATKNPQTFGEKQLKKVKRAFVQSILELRTILSGCETRSIMFEEANAPVVCGAMDSENVTVEQIYLDEKGIVTIKTEEEGGGPLGKGDYSTDDVIAVLIAVEKEIAVK